MSSTGGVGVVVDSSTDNAYLIETSILESVTALSLIVSLLLVISSMPRFSTTPIAMTKRFFHCVVTLCCILNVIKSVDNQQVFNRFHSDSYITIFFTNNITPCLMMGGAVLIYNTIDVQYRINKMPTPSILLWLLAALSVLNFVFINVCTALAVSQLKQLYYIYVLYYMVASFIILLIIADVSVWNVRSVVVKYQDRTTTSVRNKALAAEKSLYPLYAFVIFLNCLLSVVIAALIYQAVSIEQDGKSSQAPDRADPTKWKIDIFAWVHVLAIFVFIWWSWVPLHVLKPLYRKFGYESPDSTSDSHASGGHGNATIAPDPLGGKGGSHGHNNFLASPSSHAQNGGRASGGANASILVGARTILTPSTGDSSPRPNSKRSSGSFQNGLGSSNGKLFHQSTVALNSARGVGHGSGNNLTVKSSTLLVTPGTPNRVGMVGSGSVNGAGGDPAPIILGPSLDNLQPPSARNGDDIAEMSISREENEHEMYADSQPIINSNGDSPQPNSSGGGSVNSHSNHFLLNQQPSQSSIPSTISTPLNRPQLIISQPVTSSPLLAATRASGTSTPTSPGGGNLVLNSSTTSERPGLTPQRSILRSSGEVTLMQPIHESTIPVSLQNTGRESQALLPSSPSKQPSSQQR